jgi:hypothetical protein
MAAAVLRIARASQHEQHIIEVLEHYLALARRGSLRGLAVCAKGRTGQEHISVVGVYRDDPAQGVNAAMRMSWKLTQMQDD